jgi:hypothetical protein
VRNSEVLHRQVQETNAQIQVVPRFPGNRNTSNIQPMESSQSCGERLLYGRKEAAWKLSVSVRTVDTNLALGEFETRRIGKRVLITAASLKRFAASNHFGPVSSARKKEENTEKERKAA